jgi:hypothetical protein
MNKFMNSGHKTCGHEFPGVSRKPPCLRIGDRVDSMRLDRLMVPESDTKESEEAGAKRARLA